MLRPDIVRLAGFFVTLGLVFMLGTGQVFTEVAGNLLESHAPTWTKSSLVLGGIVVCASVLAWALEREEHRRWWVLSSLLLMQFAIAVYESRIADLLPGRSPLRNWPTLAAGVPIAVAAICVAQIWLRQWHRNLQYSRPGNLGRHIHDQMLRKWVGYRRQAMADVFQLTLDVTFGGLPRARAADSAALLDEVLQRGAVLLLGRQGGGKTIKLADIIAHLDREADCREVPIMADLAKYGKDAGDIGAWIAEQLAVPHRALVTLLRLAPADGGPVVMLDALDQVEPGLREHCTEAIARFHDDYPHVPVVVTSAEEISTDLPGFTRAALHWPSAGDVYKALAQAGVTPSDPLRRRLETDSEAMEFFRSPLLLSISVPERPGTEEHRVYHQLDLAAFVHRYLERQLEERKPQLRYRPEDMRRWLRFMAQTRAEVFRTDELSWENLPHTPGGPWPPFIPVGVAALAGVTLVILMFGRSVNWVNVVIWAVIGGAVGGWFSEHMILRPRLHVNWRDIFDLRAIGKGAIRGAKIASALLGLLVAGTLFDELDLLVHGPVKHTDFSPLWWATGSTAAQGVQQALSVILGILAGGLVLGGFFTIIGRALKSAASADQATPSTRRVLRSAANGLTMTVVTWSLFLVWGIIEQLSHDATVAQPLILGLVPSVCTGLYFGGLVALDRLGVRLYLYQKGDLPPRSGRFLRKIDGRGIMIPQGGGYQFRHKLIRECVSQLKD